ncbi:MAG: hypothetical protein JJU36_15775 [Phycisphaeraceae bacterium]|nr:hypothetical protein [Phycisphaeraceae bacterium]
MADQFPDRLNNGQFAKGCKPGPGRPPGRTEQLRAVLHDSITPEDVGRILRSLYAQAEAGDTQAAKLILGYAIGQPLRRYMFERDDTAPNEIRVTIRGLDRADDSPEGANKA